MTDDKSERRDYSRVNTRVREERRVEADKDWREEPIEQFVEERRGEITPEDLDAKKRVVRRFERYLLEAIAPDTDANISGVRDAVESDVVSFRDDELVPDPNIGNSTIVDKLNALSHFYRVLNRNNAFAGNPVTSPLEKFRENNNFDTSQPYIPFHRMQLFLNWLTHPFSRAFWLCGFKHGTRISEVINTDLRCIHLDHPVFWHLVEDHNLRLDPRIRDKPDTLLIYEGFNKGEEIPNEDTPGPETQGEIRDSAYGNKRKEKGGSILPIDSELKTALIEWLLVRPPSYNHVVNPLFVFGKSDKIRRVTDIGVSQRLWGRDDYPDSIQNFAAEEELEECPTCGGSVVEENLASGENTGRRFRCRKCRVDHWRSVYWNKGLESGQKMTFHQGRHYFTNAHDPGKSKLHDGAIPDFIRKKRIRGDSNSDGDTEDEIYKDKSYEEYNKDIREPYLNGIYKFDIYNTVIPAVGEGWDA